jgi:hypothetical protein
MDSAVFGIFLVGYVVSGLALLSFSGGAELVLAKRRPVPAKIDSSRDLK